MAETTTPQRRRKAPAAKPPQGKATTGAPVAAPTTPPAPTPGGDGMERAPEVNLTGDRQRLDAERQVEQEAAQAAAREREAALAARERELAQREAELAARESAHRHPDALAGLTDDERVQPYADLRIRLHHARGCPFSQGVERVEAFPSQVPEKFGGGQIIVVRCQECGAHAREDELD